MKNGKIVRDKTNYIVVHCAEPNHLWILVRDKKVDTDPPEVG